MFSTRKISKIPTAEFWIKTRQNLSDVFEILITDDILLKVVGSLASNPSAEHPTFTYQFLPSVVFGVATYRTNCDTECSIFD